MTTSEKNPRPKRKAAMQAESNMADESDKEQEAICPASRNVKSSSKRIRKNSESEEDEFQGDIDQETLAQFANHSDLEQQVTSQHRKRGQKVCKNAAPVKFPKTDELDRDPFESCLPQVDCAYDVDQSPFWAYFPDTTPNPSRNLTEKDKELYFLTDHPLEIVRQANRNVFFNQNVKLSDEELVTLKKFNKFREDILNISSQYVECFPQIGVSLHVQRPQIDKSQTCFVYVPYSQNQRVVRSEEIIIEHPDPSNIAGQPSVSNFADLEDMEYYSMKAKIDQIDSIPERTPDGQHNTSYLSKASREIVKKVKIKHQLYFDLGNGQNFVCELHGLYLMHEHMKFFRFFVHTDSITDKGFCYLSIYLKNKEVVSALERFESAKLVSNFLCKELRYMPKYGEEVNVKFEIPDTNQNVESEPAPGFQLQLRSYQKRTLNWLMELESNAKDSKVTINVRKMNIMQRQLFDLYGLSVCQLGENGPFYNMETGAVSLCDMSSHLPLVDESVECSGAILADDTGCGKTVTVLALIHSNPFKSIDHISWNPHLAQYFLPSRASLVICPSHLAQQWKLEALRVMPNAQILMLTTIIDHKKLTWNDVLFADVVITTLNFLQNKNYETAVKTIIEKSGHDSIDDHMTALKALGRQMFGSIKGQVIFQRIYWHRLVSDEFHELGHSQKQKKAAKFFLTELRGRFFLGVTGTPQYTQKEEIVEMARYLETKLPLNRLSCREFLLQRVRRNEPNLQLPPLTQELRWLDLTARERGLLMGFDMNSTAALMACNHHQLANEILNMVGEVDLTVEQVSELVQSFRLKSLAELRDRIVVLQQDCDEQLAMHKHYLNLKRSKVTHIEVDGKEKRVVDVIESSKRVINNLNAKLDETSNEINRTQGQYTFFQAVLDAVSKEEEQSCLICLESIVKGDKFCVTNCGHIYCVDCIELLLKNPQPACGMCRQRINSKDVARMTLDKTKNNADKNADGEMQADVVKNLVEYSKYGMKLAEFTNYIQNLFASGPDEKVILFIQFRRLMKLVGAALKEFGIEHVSCEGNIMMRSRSINLFKTDPKVRLILLSSEDSVSGLHLIEATTVVILHPFLLDDGSDALCMSYEKQGVARAWRGGQTHPVKLVRFLVRDSIEEVLAVRRGYKDGVITNMEFV